MKLTKYRPLFNINDLQNSFFDLDNFFESKNISSFSPVVNTRENEKGYFIEVDLPGVKKEDISVDIDKNTLLISGERKYKNEVEEKDYYKTESYFGKFQRRFVLPENIDEENIEAKNENGILEIFLPKITPKEAKKISVK